MINLLPPDAKEEALYGRRNRKLVFVAGCIGVLFIALGALTIFGQYYLSQSENQYKKSGQVVEARIADQSLAQSQKDLETLAGNFKTASQLLGKQVLFSKLFPKLGETIPSGAAVKQISIGNNDTYVEFEIRSINKAVANQSYINVSDKNNGLFEKADLLEIVCADAKATKSEDGYSCSTRIKALYRSDSPFLLLNYLKSQEATKQ